MSDLTYHIQKVEWDREYPYVWSVIKDDEIISDGWAQTKHKAEFLAKKEIERFNFYNEEERNI